MKKEKRCLLLRNLLVVTTLKPRDIYISAYSHVKIESSSYDKTQRRAILEQIPMYEIHFFLKGMCEILAYR